MLPEKLALAQAVCTRLCHDLGGAVGALAAAIELMESESRGPRDADDAAGVAHDAVRVIDRRLRFLRAAIGGCGDCGRDEIAQLAEGLTLGRRATVDTGGLAPGLQLHPAAAQSLLLATWVGMEALPRGGVVRLAGEGAERLTVWPDGPGAAWPAGLAAALAGDPPAPSPRGIAPVLLALVAAAGRVRLDLLFGPSGGAAPLMLVATPTA
ncbi:histidine phosphotransferase family protein [Falsiroseomonas sp. CW058]|uniref:histidine phosphotransferase family protein n=1 Tax=Falsiroseomonas sp. CW058 TaxID=3388664 RepID=UPI003D320C8B